MNYELILTYIIVAVGVYTIFYLLWTLYQNYLIKKMTATGVLLEVVLEKDTDKEPFALEQIWSSFHGLYIPWYKRITHAQPYISFEIKSENDQNKKKKEITFNFWVPEEYKQFLKQRILGTYPNAQIFEIKGEKDYIPAQNDGVHIIETAELGLAEDSAFSIRTFDDYEADPLAGITAALTELENREIAIVQVVARPHDPKWRRHAARILERYEKTGKKPKKNQEWMNFFSGFLRLFFLMFEGAAQGFSNSKVPEVKIVNNKSSMDTQRQKDMLEKVNRNPFAIQIRILVGTPYGKEEAKKRVNSIIAAFKELDGPNNGIKREVILNKNRTYKRIKNRHLGFFNNDDILSTWELASFCHLPNKNLFTPGLKKIQSKQAENPVDISTENAFGVANFRGQQFMVGMDELARMRHVYVSGMTGVGKSVLLENMIINDIEQGRGVVCIDPHGELIDTILEKVSAKREDIFVLDPSDIAHPFGMNLLELTATDPVRRELEKVLVVDSYITVMKRIFGSGAIGPNTDDLFRMSASAIVDHPEGGSLLEMLLMLVSDAYRARVVQFIKDPIVENYWTEVFPALAGKGNFVVQNLNAPLNKIRRFIANGLVANIICQQKSTLNIADAMNSGAVILARFSRGDMGFENSALLGSMLIAKVQLAAMQRVSIPMEQRIPTYLYVDELKVAPLCSDTYRKLC